MRVIDTRPSRPSLDAGSPRRAHPAVVVPEDPPFGAVIGALIGILVSVPLWVLIGIVVLVLRRG